MKELIIKLDVFRLELHVVIGKWKDCQNSIDAYVKDDAKLDYDTPPEYSSGFFINCLDAGWDPVIWLEEPKRNIFVHEAIHFIEAFCKFHEIKDEECKAYVFQYVFEEFDNYMVSLNKQSKPKVLCQETIKKNTKSFTGNQKK